MNANSDIMDSTNYICNSRYISGRIVEYDIKSANISIMRDKNIITEDEYEFLSLLPKNIREREVGLMEQKDPRLYEEISGGIKSARKDLFSFNNLDSGQIVRIANDAVYVNTAIDLKYVKFGDHVEFKKKNQYNSFVNLNNIIVLFKFLSSGDIHVDFKGIGQNVELHRNYMVYIITSTIAILERSGISDALSYISDICEKYLHRELSIEYYREFNPDSLYRSVYHGAFNSDTYGMFSVREQDKEYIDISFNYNILRELWSIIFELYTLKGGYNNGRNN